MKHEAAKAGTLDPQDAGFFAVMEPKTGQVTEGREMQPEKDKAE